MNAIEDKIRRKGLELGFSNVGFTTVRDYPEYLEEARSRLHFDIFAGADEALLTRLSQTKTRNPWAKGIVCATLGFASIDYPEHLARSVARTYLARVPQRRCGPRQQRRPLSSSDATRSPQDHGKSRGTESHRLGYRQARLKRWLER